MVSTELSAVYVFLAFLRGYARSFGTDISQYYEYTKFRLIQSYLSILYTRSPQQVLRGKRRILLSFSPEPRGFKWCLCTATGA